MPLFGPALYIRRRVPAQARLFVPLYFVFTGFTRLPSESVLSRGHCRFSGNAAILGAASITVETYKDGTGIS